MRDRHHGHPFGGTLIIGAIFSVALAFYLTTPPARLQSTSAPAPLSLHAAPITAHAPAIVESATATRLESRLAEPVALVQTNVTQHDPTSASGVAPPVAVPDATLRAFSWSTTPSAYPAAASPVRTSEPGRGLAPSGPAVNGGAVTHAFATASSAVRSAFRRAF